MYRSLEELCRMERETGKPFWKIVQENDCVEQGISAEESFAQMRGMYQAMQYADAHYDEAGAGGGNAALRRLYRKSDGKSAEDQRVQCLHEADRGGTDRRLLRCGTGSVFECAGGARFF